MLGILKNKKNSILNHIIGDFSEKLINNKNFIFANHIENIKKFILKNNLMNLKLIVINKKKKSFIKVLNLLILIYSYKKFKKNFIFMYKFKNYVTANNLIPDWPSNYQKLNFVRCCYVWIKNMSKIIFFYNKIELIIIQKK